jgi:hypothetical protein
MFATGAGDKISYSDQPPDLDKIKRKNILLILKANFTKDTEPITEENIGQ